jgi:hypothetical protein
MVKHWQDLIINGAMLTKLESEVLAVKYDEIKAFSYNLLLVRAGNKYGVFEETGKQRVPVRYQNIVKADFLSKRYPVQLNDKWGLVSDFGKEVTAIKYQEIGLAGENLWPAKLNDKWGFIDSSGKEIISHIFEKIGAYNSTYLKDYASFYNGLAMVLVNGKWGAIDKSGKLLIPARYDEIQFYDNYDGVK